MMLEKTETQSYPGLEYLPSGNGTEYKIGQCLKIASGVAALGADEPEYICFGERTGKTGDLIPAIRILAGETYAAPLSQAGTALKIGDKVSIASDGIRLTATTGGIAEIIGFATASKAAGDLVYVKFRKED